MSNPRVIRTCSVCGDVAQIYGRVAGVDLVRPCLACSQRINGRLGSVTGSRDTPFDLVDTEEI